MFGGKELSTPLPPGSVVGILGGGQLGRMLALAAAPLGLRTHIFAPEKQCPAKQVTALQTTADYDDADALDTCAEEVDVITYEFENVPAKTVDTLCKLGAAVAPGAKALEVAQDRLVEKEFVRSIGARTAPFYAVDDLASLDDGLTEIGRPAILKTRRLGYDGKGQTVIAENDAGSLGETWAAAQEKAWAEIGARPAILEGFIDFQCEISIIGARSYGGAIELYAPSENSHREGILRRSVVPARVSEKAADEARRITAELLTALEYVGVIGVEFFVLGNDDLMINEFAPRVHNSGHWTADACAVSQFEQHVRAVANWPLGDPTRHSNAVMENLIGDESDDWAKCAREKQLCLHLYGKDRALPGRKMGHVTALSHLTK